MHKALANSADLEQFLGAVWSWSTMLAVSERAMKLCLDLQIYFNAH